MTSPYCFIAWSHYKSSSLNTILKLLILILCKFNICIFSNIIYESYTELMCLVYYNHREKARNSATWTKHTHTHTKSFYHKKPYVMCVCVCVGSSWHDLTTIIILFRQSGTKIVCLLIISCQRKFLFHSNNKL